MASSHSRIIPTVVVIGGALSTAVALLLAIIPMSSDNTTHPSCGSALIPNLGNHFDATGDFFVDALVEASYEMGCERALGPMRGWAITLAVIGVILLIMGIIALVSRPKPAQTIPAAASNVTALATQLSELAQLRESGALTEEEFTEAKRRLMNGSGSSRAR